MILYLDTSALVKRYFHEPDSDKVLDAWRLAKQVVTSHVAYAEGMAAIYRKIHEERLTRAELQNITASFQSDWQGFIRIEVNDRLNPYIDKVLDQSRLRGFDAIHLASALLVRERFHHGLLFACFDTRLASAARLHGLKTLPA